MELERRETVRNLAIIGHVDHGKSTLVDAMLWGTTPSDDADRGIVRTPDPDREKRLVVTPSVTSISYRRTRVNLLDLPTHAYLGGDVDRIVRLAEGLLFVVDAAEGPVPQCRLVLREALRHGLAPVVVLSKIDRPDADPAAAREAVRDLFLDVDASERQRAFPSIECDSLRGRCRRSEPAVEGGLEVLLDTVLEHVPAPAHEASSGLRLAISRLEYDELSGRVAFGRVVSGSVRRGDDVVRLRPDARAVPMRIGALYGYVGERRVEVREAGPGDVVAVGGLEAPAVGDTIAGSADAEPLELIRPFRPTIAIRVWPNDSPTSGEDGPFASPPDLRQRLWREILTNDALRVEDVHGDEAFDLQGRSELQLAILLEMMRREGYEMLVGPPRAIRIERDGRVLEPTEALEIDCPEDAIAVVTQKIEARGGRMQRMVNHGRGRVWVDFRIPSCAMFGFRSEFLSDTRGRGILSHRFDAFEPVVEERPERATGALVADRAGRATAHAIEHLQSRGAIFVAPGDAVYAGMIVGENGAANDLHVNITKLRRAGTGEPHANDDGARLIPPRSMSLEQAIEHIRDDEVVEVTPRALRLRKLELPGNAEA